ncbi:MAG TPA: alpha/beta hydrolase [Thermodesulfobacteriota bacterium]|nr:alpha/beta hydrolase [Thermodesulfobacteriota bacterium]
MFKDFKEQQIKTTEVTINIKHAGSGKPLLLLHGYPQTHVMWHKVAPKLTKDFHVICADLRGYGDSSKPENSEDNYTYSKRAMAGDMIEVMKALGYEKFYVAGHDRGGRVVHRMCLDYPDNVQKACVMDIAPTHTMFSKADKIFATGYYHWFFLIQPGGLPEKMIGSDPEYYLTEKLKRWSGKNKDFHNNAVIEYVRCFSSPDAIAASCADYKAAASIDLEHDEKDFNNKIICPLLVLWGNEGFVHRTYDVLQTWEEKAENVTGKALNSGHFVAEENPQETLDEILSFFKN